MNILEKLLGEAYPKLGSTVCADGNRIIVTVSRTLSPDHVDLDSPSYVKTKFRKHIPILTSIIARGISEIAEDRLSEPNAIKVIDLDCKQFICTDDEPEKTQADV